VAERGHLIQAKGKGYELGKLLVDPELAERLDGGAYLTIYLAPRDYHRVHSPVDAELLGYNYVPGALFPVNSLFSRHIDNLLTVNERMVLPLRAAAGSMALVMVGAAGVGNVTLCHPHVEARELRRARTLRRVRLKEAVPIDVGQELGAFHLGSTVIMVFEPGRVDLGGLAPGKTLCFGEPIGRSRSPSRSGNGRNG
jgi:phosphatidylserine decarboxylase